MRLLVYSICVVALFFGKSVANEKENPSEHYDIGGFYFEVLVNKLEFLSQQVEEMKSVQDRADRKMENLKGYIAQELEKVRQDSTTERESLQETLMEELRNQKTLFEKHQTQQKEQNDKITSVLEKMNSDCYKNTQEMNAIVQSLSHNISVLHERTVSPSDHIQENITSLQNNSSAYGSCRDVPKVSGKYEIITGDGAKFDGFCVQTTDYGGGWLIIQQRLDGKTDFFRGWNEYRDGFGDVRGEHWLGLENVYRLTSRGRYELMVEVKKFSGEYGYARFDDFEISDESDGYRLKKKGKYSGTAGDSLIGHVGQKFSTKDRDQDSDSSLNCATQFTGAWWYHECHYSNLNGKYIKERGWRSICWDSFAGMNGLSYSRMMIRKTP